MNIARLLGIAMACVLVGSVASARDLKTLNGEVFKNITITKQDPTGLQISHDDGVIFIDFRNLGPAEQKEFGYDPAAYVAAWKQRVEADKARREQAAARAKGQGATAAAPSSTPVPFPPYTPTNQTGVEFYYDSPGFRWGPYDYTGRGFSNTIPPRQGGAVPYPNNPYGPYPYYYGPTWGPPIIRQR
jgi:hypothetical protein